MFYIITYNVKKLFDFGYKNINNKIIIRYYLISLCVILFMVH